MDNFNDKDDSWSARWRIRKHLKSIGKDKEFEGNPELEKDFQDALQRAKTFPEDPENLARIKKIDEYLLAIDKKCLALNTEDELVRFLRKELDNLIGQREKWVYNSVLEDEIVLVSIKYYKIVWVPPR